MVGTDVNPEGRMMRARYRRCAAKAMGVPRDRGSQYQVESVKSAKEAGEHLWLDKYVSRGASNLLIADGNDQSEDDRHFAVVISS